MSDLGKQNKLNFTDFLSNNLEQPTKKRGAKKINSDNTLTVSVNSPCYDCILKNKEIESLKNKFEKINEKMNEKKKEKKVLTEDEINEIARIKEEKKAAKELKEMKLVTLENENQKLKAELLTRFGVNI